MGLIISLYSHFIICDNEISYIFKLPQINKYTKVLRIFVVLGMYYSIINENSKMNRIVFGL